MSIKLNIFSIPILSSKFRLCITKARGNRIFPVSDKSMDVLRAFEKELNEAFENDEDFRAEVLEEKVLGKNYQ